VRRAWAAAALLAATATPSRAADDDAAGRAFVELVASKSACVVGERIRLRLRVGFDAAYFRDHAVQAYQQRLDVPARVESPWFHRPKDAVLRAADDQRAAGLSFALDDEVASAPRVADETRGGRAFAVIERSWTCVPTRAGDLTIPAPALRFTHATRFDDDAFGGRTPADRAETLVRGAALVVHAAAPPAGGRPDEFGGAVGRFTVAADVDRRDVAAGESFKLTLRVEGDGELDLFDAPSLAGLAGFHVYGVLDEKADARRTLVYETAATRDDVREIPSIPFAFFDPADAAYHVVRTSPIALRVRPAATPSSRDEPARPTTLRWIVVESAAAGLAIVALLLVRRSRAKRSPPGDERPVREEAARFQAELAAPGADVAQSLAAFVAACLRCPTAAVIAPDLASRLVAAGASLDVAKRTSELLERLVAARYGGGSSSGEADAARAVVDDLVREL